MRARETEFAVELRGTYLDGAKELRFVHPGIVARVESAGFRQVRARVRIQPSVETGRHEFRLGSDKARASASFSVSSVDESFEAEPNDSLVTAQEVTPPALINGRCDGADGDYFHFLPRRARLWRSTSSPRVLVRLLTPSSRCLTIEATARKTPDYRLLVRSYPYRRSALPLGARRGARSDAPSA